MAAIPGIRFDITGASGSQGLLTPKSGWRCYVLPRGGYASQDSTGTLLTFDSAAIAGRFAALDWIQAGLSAANIRQVAAVGGNSLSVSGAALTVAENDRIFIIGSTEPTISGGSVTYSTPATTVRQRDDDGSDLYANSMITTNADGLVQFFSTPAVYDCVIQDGNRALQGSLIDVPVGVAEGVSTSQATVFGATVTINAALGITGWATFGQTVTMNAALGVTGWATFGATVTMNANAGVTGTFAVGATSTFTGKAAFGNSVSIDGALGVTGIAGFSGRVYLTERIAQTVTTGSNTFTGSIASTLDVTGRRLVASGAGVTLGTSYFTLGAGWGSTASITLGTGTKDAHGSFIVSAFGATFAQYPTVHLAYAEGNWSGGLGGVVCRNFAGPYQFDAIFGISGIDTSGITFIFGGTPSSGQEIGAYYMIIG